jgi:NAD(P)-dependent dehydrogenase (short-subunit alcohol dehydrogenase family)
MKIAIVTGASRGIGAATAKKLATQGYAVCVNYNKSQKDAELVVSIIVKAGGKAIAVQADMGVEADIMRLFKTVDTELGPVTALVNNAAVQYSSSVADSEWNMLESVFHTNMLGIFISCREALPRMKKGGAIVNITSEAARFGGNSMSAYAASKAALNTFTIGFAREAAKRNVRVNAVSPGVIDTDAHRGADVERLATLRNSIPMSRMGTVEEVANVIAWLLSDEASYVTGSIIPVTGGR